MRKLLCVLLVCLSVAAGCSRPESKIYGVWVHNQKGIVSMDFNRDNSGTVRDPAGNTKFKWSMLKDGKVKVEMDFLPSPSFYELKGDRLVCLDSTHFDFVRKK